MEIYNRAYYINTNLVLIEHYDLYEYSFNLSNGYFPIEADILFQYDSLQDSFILYRNNVIINYEYSYLARGGIFWSVIHDASGKVISGNISTIEMRYANGRDWIENYSKQFDITSIDYHSNDNYPFEFVVGLYTNEEELNQYIQSYITEETENNYWIGYVDGKTIGFTEGYQQGASESSEMTNTFTLLGGAFDSLSGIMNVNLIGGLTIGGMIGIPLAISVIVVIFKMLRK